MLILKEPLNYGGRMYEVGDNVRGKLPLDLLKQLQENGHLEEQEEEATVEPGVEEGTPGTDPSTSADDSKTKRSQNRG